MHVQNICIYHWSRIISFMIIMNHFFDELDINLFQSTSHKRNQDFRIVPQNFSKYQNGQSCTLRQSTCEAYLDHANLHAITVSLYSLSDNGDVMQVTSDTRPSCFTACNLISWEWPGDDANTVYL